MPARDLRWDGCLNVRDLGGHATEDGQTTRFGAVVRADSVRRLSDAGWEALVSYGVRRVLDLRFADELAADPPRELPVEVVHVSLLGDPDPEWWEELNARTLAEPDAAAATTVVYLALLERFAPNFARALAVVAEAPDGAVVVHCQGGKDRTGLMVALLLRLAGVPPEDVARDYAATTANLAEVHDAWIAEADSDQERRRRTHITASPFEAMRDVLEELEGRYGGAEGYLRAAGVPEEALDRIRARLLG